MYATSAEIGGIQVTRIRNEGKRNRRVEIALAGPTARTGEKIG